MHTHAYRDGNECPQRHGTISQKEGKKKSTLENKVDPCERGEGAVGWPSDDDGDDDDDDDEGIALECRGRAPYSLG